MKEDGKAYIMVRLDPADKKLVQDAAYKERIPTASWARNVIVSLAKESMGVTK